MSEIIHWEQMEDFDLETALRLMARGTMANFVWDHWAKCRQVERLLAKYNDACKLLLEKNDTITEQSRTIEGLRTNADRNGILQGNVQHLKGQLTVQEKEMDKELSELETELGKAYKVIKALQDEKVELLMVLGVEQ